MKKYGYFLAILFSILVILQLIYFLGPQNPVPAQGLHQPAELSHSTHTQADQEKVHRFNYGWLKATVSFSLKGTDGSEYGLTFRLAGNH